MTHRWIIWFRIEKDRWIFLGRLAEPSSCKLEEVAGFAVMFAMFCILSGIVRVEWWVCRIWISCVESCAWTCTWQSMLRWNLRQWREVGGSFPKCGGCISLISPDVCPFRKWRRWRWLSKRDKILVCGMLCSKLLRLWVPLEFVVEAETQLFLDTGLDGFLVVRTYFERYSWT